MRGTEVGFPLLLVGLFGCKPEVVIPTETGTVIDTGEPFETYFEPVLWQVREVMFLWNDGAFEDFHYESGGSPRASFMTIRFMSQEYLETGASEGYCDWTTELELREENDRGDPGVWTGMQLEPDTSESTCSGFDPEYWEDGSPIEHMETASLWFGIGPAQALTSVVENLYEQLGQDWTIEGEPYVFSLFFGLWDGDSLGLLPSEVNYAVAYETTVDGAIRYDGDGDALLEEVGDELPSGVIRSFPYHSSPMSELPP